MDEAEELEHACADAWPAEVDERLGEWRMRAAGGFTGRANSTLAVGDPGMPVADALAMTETFATTHGITPTAQVVAGSAAERAIERAGWAPKPDHPGGTEVRVLVGPLGEPEDSRAIVHDTVPKGWWPLVVGADEPAPAERRVLTGGNRVGFAELTLDGAVVAVGRGAVVDDLLHIARLAVAPAHRRRGLAVELMAALTHWGATAGAKRGVLQVADHNAGAISLYHRLGYVEHHRYRYWTSRTR